ARGTPRRHLRGPSPLPRGLRVRDVWATPRPVPPGLLPKIAGAAVIALALPVFLAAGLSLRGWLLGAVLWIAAEALARLLSRLPLGADNVGAAGVRGVGMMFRSVTVMVIVIVAAAAHAEGGLGA